ncbi:MAG: helix-turn-helix domain-containing protein [Actinomycetota bacterium]|nr:helix-turn-helix domain-containing protein [Actinomycetota bacterium]
MATKKAETRSTESAKNKKADSLCGGPGSDIKPKDLLRLIAEPLPAGKEAPPDEHPPGSLEPIDIEGNPPEHLISAKQLSRYLQVPVSWCWRAAREGTIPHYRCGQYIRFDLDKVLNSLKREKDDHDAYS